eukprot:Amastigsp_a341317_87.p1 type:complete len:110 gc:universal Amastigsp_a341317_87:176-505(+)
MVSPLSPRTYACQELFINASAPTATRSLSRVSTAHDRCERRGGRRTLFENQKASRQSSVLSTSTSTQLPPPTHTHCSGQRAEQKQSRVRRAKRIEASAPRAKKEMVLRW